MYIDYAGCIWFESIELWTTIYSIDTADIVFTIYRTAMRCVHMAETETQIDN